MTQVASDLTIKIPNKPGELAKVARAVSDAGINISATTCLVQGETAELHILVPYSEPVYRALANTQGPSITHEREVVVIQAKDRPGELSELAQKVASANINLDLIYVASQSRLVLGAQDIESLKEVLDGFQFSV